MMEKPPAWVHALAQQLLALEAASRAPSDPHEAVRVCERLRISLTRFAGEEGFRALLRRAVALAKAEVPALQSVTVKPDCSMEGIEQLASVSRADAADAAAAITAHLLSLLVTFIGKPLTLQMVRGAWPDAALEF